MYGVIAGLRKRMGWSQTDLAKKLRTNQAQVSRLEGATASSFSELCNKLRHWIKDRPENSAVWLDLLAGGETAGLFDDFIDLFLISEAVDPKFDEYWVVAETPAECRRTSLRQRIAARIKETRDATPQCRIVYWVPTEAKAQMTSLALAFRDDDGLTLEQLREQVFWIHTAKQWTLIPFAIGNPLRDSRIGFISPDTELTDGVRVVVLPRATTARLVAELQPLFRNLQHRPHAQADAKASTIQSLAELIEVDAGSSAPPDSRRRSRR